MTIVMTILADDNARNRRRARRAAQREQATQSAKHAAKGCHKALSLPALRQPKESVSGVCLPQVAMYSAGHRTVRKDAVHIIK